MGNRLINARCRDRGQRGQLPARLRGSPVPRTRQRVLRVAAAPSPGAAQGRPYFARPPDDSLLGLGGVWEVWHGPDDQVLRTVAIITTIANNRLADVHDRMPVIVEPADWARWLEPRPLEPDEAGRLLRSPPEELVELVEVSDLVNSPKNDTPELLEPVH